MKKVFIKTFGCQMNEHDSQRMAAMLEKEGYAQTLAAEEADLILVNTCSVRANPENKVYSYLGQTVRPIKDARPSVIVGVCGCVARQAGEKIFKDRQVVDMVFGPDHVFELPEMLKRVRAGQRVLRTTDRKPENGGTHDFIPQEELKSGVVEGGRAYVAIMKGCDNFCTFCIVPHVRGREESRPAGKIAEEIIALVEKGAVEVTLLGQNVNSFRAGETGFYELLEMLVKVPGLRRLRFMSPHPKDWDDRLTGLMAREPVICKALHLPLQSGSDRVLKAMNRKHTLEEYLAKVEGLREKIPGVEITTDLIVGFPGETDGDFEATLKAMERAKFASAFAFKYSPRPGTAAAKMKDDVPRKVKDERLKRLQETQKRLSAERLQGMVGRREEILIESAHETRRDTVCGRTDNGFSVALRDCALEPGQTAVVEITGFRQNSLEAKKV